MTDWTNTFAPIVGRIFLGGFFLWSGIEKIVNFTAYVGMLADHGTPQALPIALVIISIEVVAGISLIVDFNARIAALVLAIYIAAASIGFFGAFTTAGVHSFLQNMAILGGLFLAIAFGAGRYSRDWQN